MLRRWSKRLLRAVQAVTRHLRGTSVPVVLQVAAVDCAAACLVMILRSFGRAVSLGECRRRLGVGRDGTSAFDLVQAARSYGLEVEYYLVSPDQLVTLEGPTILGWRQSHFVVLEGVRRTRRASVRIVDPAVGRRRLSLGEAKAGFGGLALTFRRGPNWSDVETGQRHPWWTVIDHLLAAEGWRRLVVHVLVASLAIQLLGLVVPLVTRAVVDQLMTQPTQDVLRLMFLGVAMWLFAQSLFDFVRGAMLALLRSRLDAHLMTALFRHLVSLPLGFFQLRGTGDLTLRQGSTGSIREILSDRSLAAILDGTSVAVYACILFAAEPWFAALALGAGALQCGLLLGTTVTIHRIAERELSTRAEAQSFLVDAITGMTTLKAGGRESRAIQKWSRLLGINLSIGLRLSLWDAAIHAGLRLIQVLAPVLLLWTGARLVMQGQMSLGTMLALSSLAAMLLAPMVSLVSSGRAFQQAGAHLERLADVFEEPPEEQGRGRQRLESFSGSISLRSVVFKYQRGGTPVLRGIDVDILPGQSIGLAGPTGAGKSTLALVLLALLRPEEGEILFDGISVDRLDLQSLRSHCAIVLQEPYLFQGSLVENVSQGEPDIGMKEVIDACRRARIHEEISRLPMGYETRVGEGGAGLSGGQRQRIALARALARRPSLLVLDEATSHLDSRTECEIQRELEELPMTRVVIAHRLSTLRTADLILFLDDGRIVERGTHRELLATGARYAGLYEMQAQMTS